MFFMLAVIALAAFALFVATIRWLAIITAAIAVSIWDIAHKRRPRVLY
ncbi:MAG TPA: hypothetical protein VJQ83_02185 [Tepidiformaceae bacterium]|nr:hypothetical protein [Tepidiformaceae bacterium]